MLKLRFFAHQVTARDRQGATSRLASPNWEDLRRTISQCPGKGQAPKSANADICGGGGPVIV